jgi:nucleoside-diphosphate-sugar epimerase
MATQARANGQTRVFVAGAAGVIGRVLVPQLLADGYEVTGMTRSETRAAALRQMGASAVICDVFDAPRLREAVADAAPDVVIHELTDLPTRLEPRKYKTQLAGTNRIRRDGTRNLVAAAREAGVTRLIAQSIAFIYAPVGDWVKDEEAPLALDAPAPLNDAARAVDSLERQVQDAGGVVLRYGFFYGPGTQMAPDGFLAELVRKRRLPVIGSGAARWSFIHIDDAAAATVAALSRTHSGPAVYNIVDDEPAAVTEWLPVYAAALGAKPPFHVPVWLGRLGGGVAAVSGMTEQRGASNAKAKRELGWAPAHASWRDGFRSAAG